MQEMLIIDGRSFELLGMQRGGAAVYRGKGDYLRIGPKESIEHDLALHREMEKARFPVPAILMDGEAQGQRYFVESSAGSRSFRAVFQDDIDAHSVIAEDHFDAFVGLVKKLHDAQKKHAKGPWDREEFAAGIRLSELCKELPVHAEAIRKRFDTAMKRLSSLPRALTHGDCNPANMYERGIIDLEDSFYGPLGYDAASALETIEWSPELRSYEFFAQYRFSDAQKSAYKKTFRAIAKHFADFAFCRAVWLCSGMGEWPRIQQWRFEKFIHEFLS